MSEEFKLSDLVNIPSGGLTKEDVEKYNGTKTKIVKATPIKKQVPYSEEFGKMLPEGQTREVAVVELETEPIGTDALGQPITIKEEFSLKKHPVTGKYGPSLHEKSKSFKLFNLLKINNFEQAIGQSVVVIKKVRQSGTTYLGFAI